MAAIPPDQSTPGGIDPRIHLCEVCGKTAILAHHEIRGDRSIDHWRCYEHRPQDWPKLQLKLI